MLTVRIFLDGKQVDPSQLPQITISNPTIDRIVNEILEQTFGGDIADRLNNADDPVPQTNLITSKAYGRAHGKSREQVKQYLIQGNRVLGATKIGRDWVLTSDAKFPADHRKKLQR